jgi:hypothetical protein
MTSMPATTLCALAFFTLSLFSCSKPLPGPSPTSDSQWSSTLPESIRFTGEVSYQTVDANLDGYYDGLVVEVELEIDTPGEYLILGTLEKAGQLIANRPVYESMLHSEARFSANQGKFTAAIAFSGEQIRQSGEDGSYDLTLDAIGDQSYATLTIKTPFYNHTRFAEIGAVIQGVTHAAIDDDGEGEIESIESSLEVEVRTPGDYHLQGNLRRGDVEIDEGKRFTLPWGVHTLKLRFPIPPMHRIGMIWPFEGVVNIIDGTGHTIGGIEFLIDPLSLELVPEDIIDPSLKLTIAAEKSAYSLEEGNNIQITARFENTSEETLLLAHPNISRPGDLEEGVPFDPNQSNIFVQITAPDGNEIHLRNSMFHWFLPTNEETAGEDHLILPPGEAAEVTFYKFHPYSNINPWEEIREPLFAMRGSFQIQVVFTNNYPCAWLDNEGCAEAWTGEIASNVLLIEIT